MSVTPLGLSSSSRERPAQPHGLSTSTELRVVRQPPSAVSRRREALAVAVPTLLLGLAVALFDGLALLPLACAVVCAGLAGLRTPEPGRGHTARTLVRADSATAGVLGLALAMAGVVELVALTDVRWGLAVVATSLVASVALRFLRVPDGSMRRVVLVGAREDIETYTATVRNPGLLVAGGIVLDALTTRAGHAALGFPLSASLDTVSEMVSSVGADAVLVLPGRDVDSEVVRRVSGALGHDPVAVAVVCPVASVSGHRMRPTVVGGTTLLGLDPVRPSAVALRVKAVVDRVCAGLMLLVAAPVLAVLMLAIRVDSRGPAIFMQTRVGRDGVPFRMFKFRSMYVDAESMKQALLEENESDGALFKIRRDPRITRLGFWLRRSSLDELPQLVNVVLGHMSLIGPRPALPDEVERYDETARRRLAVKPGITGLWQVSGRSDLGWEESLQLDIYYAENWRLRDDLVIAARTVTAVAFARGAY